MQHQFFRVAGALGSYPSSLLVLVARPSGVVDERDAHDPAGERLRVECGDHRLRVRDAAASGRRACDLEDLPVPLLPDPPAGRVAAEGLDQLIEELGLDNVYVQYDCYHAQRSEGELAGTLSRYLPYIAHVQVADEAFDMQPGDSCFFPADTVHVFTVTSDTPVKLLVIYSPPYGESPDKVIRPQAA